MLLLLFATVSFPDPLLQICFISLMHDYESRARYAALAVFPLLELLQVDSAVRAVQCIIAGPPSV